MPTLSSRRNRLSQRQSDVSVAGSPAPQSMITTLPPYEPPIAPLNAKAQIALSGLLNNPSLAKLQKQLADAASLLHSVAGDLNDYDADCRETYTKKKARRAGNEEELEEEKEQAERGRRVEVLTRKLDHAVRKTVDEEVLVGTLPEMMEAVVTQASGEGENNATGQTQSSFPTQTQRSKSRRTMIDEDDGEEEENEEGKNTNTQPQEESAVSIPSATAAFASALESYTASRDSQSLFTRYANHNTYVAFKQSVHDAQHHEENAPPLPNRKTWFAAEEKEQEKKQRQQQHRGTSPGESDDEDRRDTTVRHPRRRTSPSPAPQQSDDDDEEDELEVRSEKISTKCPITFLPFQQPLTSSKCRHSFESHAILDMLSRSKDSVPVSSISSSQPTQSQRGGARGGFVKAVKCPICSTLNTREDLREDHVLARKVRRLEALETQRLEQMDEDDEEKEDDEDERAQRGKGMKKENQGKVLVGSSPPKSLRTQRQIKGEEGSGRAAVMMGQMDGAGESEEGQEEEGEGEGEGEEEPPPGTAATVVDLGSDEEDGDEDEEEEEGYDDEVAGDDDEEERNQCEEEEDTEISDE